MKPLLAMLAALSLTLAACSTIQPRDSKNIQGTWLPAKAELAGDAMTEDFLKGTILTVGDGNYEVIVGDARDKGTFTLNPQVNPKTMDINGVEGANAGKHFPAIYELHDDTLRVCYELGGGPRPTDFNSPPGTKIFLVIYQRKETK